ncbi:MAG: FAD-dependent protein [Alistipes sp.]
MRASSPKSAFRLRTPAGRTRGLAGLRFQQQFEELAYRQIGDRQIAPAQRLADFVAGKRPIAAALLLRAGHRRDANGTVDARHDFRRAAGRPGLFDKKLRGFVTNEALSSASNRALLRRYASRAIRRR